MYKAGDKCLICIEGELSEKIIAETFNYNGNQIKIPDYQVFKCNVCGEAFVSQKTIRTTEKILTDFRRGIDGLLTSDEIKAIREKLGKTQTEMADFLEVGEKTFARYENGQVTQSRSMDYLLRMLDNAPHAFFNIKTKKKAYPKYEVLYKPSKECSVNYSMDTNKKNSNTYRPKLEIKLNAA